MVKMAKPKVMKTQPEWLKKIADEQAAAQGRAIEGRIALVEARIELEDTIEEINAKHKTAFDIGDLIGVTAEEMDYVIELTEGDESED